MSFSCSELKGAFKQLLKARMVMQALLPPTESTILGSEKDGNDTLRKSQERKCFPFSHLG